MVNPFGNAAAIAPPRQKELSEGVLYALAQLKVVVASNEKSLKRGPKNISLNTVTDAGQNAAQKI